MFHVELEELIIRTFRQKIAKLQENCGNGIKEPDVYWKRVGEIYARRQCIEEVKEIIKKATYEDEDDRHS